MGPYAFTQAFLSGFFAFASVAAFVIWSRTRRDLSLFVLALSAVVWAMQSAAVLFVASSLRVDDVERALELRLITGSLGTAAVVWVFSDLTGVRARPFAWFVTLVMAAATIIAIAGVPVAGIVTGVERASLPWGETFSSPTRSDPSGILIPLYVVVVSATAFTIVCAIRLLARDRIGGAFLLLAALAHATAAVFGILIDVFHARLPYLGMFGAATGMVVAALQLARGRVMAEEGKAQLEQQLLQAERMEALGQLAGGVAHDFNNLLTVIAGHTEMLLDEMPAEGRADLEQIRHACERASSMTRQLLAFSRRSVLEPKIIDVNTVIMQTATLLRRTIGDQIALTVTAGKNLPQVKVDPDQLSRVLLNMAINARDAMPGGGKLRIETRKASVSGRDDGRPPGEYVVVAMSDTGSGIPPEVKARLFEPFFTTKAPGKGTGLGLSVVDGIVKQSGGWVDVESEVGAGTTFHLFLPATAGDTIASAATHEAPPARGTETVLLVEDERAVRDVTQKALEGFGYTVLPASSGEEALRTAATAQGGFDLLLTDVQMADMSGPQLAERLRRDYPALAVVFMSGFTSDTVLRQRVESGEADFVQKPFNTAVLAARLREILDRR
jgi:signal transduction histidine kinase/ActR/RegA family two-component response regulator